MMTGACIRQATLDARLCGGEDLFTRALTDPRLIAYCKERDMIEAGYTKAGTNWIKDIKVFGEPPRLQTWQEDH